jgi:GNAT superfamily N-acetyltransferase
MSDNGLHSDDQSAAIVVEISAVETHPLRLAVLRQDVPTKVVEFPEDDWPGAVHLGIRIDGELLAVSSWIPRPYRDEPAVQLRGMATAHTQQSKGLGGLLLRAGCARSAADGYGLVWARARDAALTFYERHGFFVDSDGFVDANTQLPHHVVVRRVD